MKHQRKRRSDSRPHKAAAGIRVLKWWQREDLPDAYLAGKWWVRMATPRQIRMLEDKIGRR